MQQISWDQFGLKAESKQKSFEDLCMFLCCRELGITKIEAYQNQPGIETEPFEVNGKKYGFQAKFFESKFDWSQITHSINKAIDTYPELSKIFIYSNKDKTKNLTKNTKVQVELGLEKKAKKKKVELEYITEKDIQLKLSLPSNLDLAQLFFGSGDEFGFIKKSTNPEILTFLQSSEYLELPFVDKKKESFSGITNKILTSTKRTFLISGHPGSGKSIFMHKFLQVLSGLDKESEDEMVKVLINNDAVPILVNLKNSATDSLESILRGRKGDYRVNNKELGFIYLFDGLDELSEKNADYVLSQIYELSYASSTKKIIISCRSGNLNKIKAKTYFSEITEYQIANLEEGYIDKYFKAKKDIYKLENLKELKTSNKTLIKDIRDIFLIKLLWDTIGELNSASTIIDLFSKKIDLLLENPAHRKNIEELNLPNPKKEQIIKLNQDISYEFQKEFQFLFPYEKLQYLIFKRFERLDYRSANLILNYLADLFFENSHSENQNQLTTYVYQHRRYQEFFFAQKLKNEYEKNPKVLRELNVLSNREFFEDIFLKYLRKEYEKENNLAGLLELNLINVYLGKGAGYGAGEPYYKDSKEFVPAVASQNEDVLNELLENENLSLREKILVDFDELRRQFEKWNEDSKDYYSTEYLRNIWENELPPLIEKVVLFWRSRKKEVAIELINQIVKIYTTFKANKFSDNLRPNYSLSSPIWSKYESYLYYLLAVKNESVKDVLENSIRAEYKNFSEIRSYSFQEEGKEKLVNSFFRVCLREKKDELFNLLSNLDEYEFLAFLNILKSTEFLPFFVQSQKAQKKIKAFVKDFSGQITKENLYLLFYKRFFAIKLSDKEITVGESELFRIKDERGIDWRMHKSYLDFSLISYALNLHSFQAFLRKQEGYSSHYYNEIGLYAALFTDFVCLLKGEKSIEAIVRDYIRFINFYNESTSGLYLTSQISFLWAHIFSNSSGDERLKASLKNRLITKENKLYPFGFYLDLNRLNETLFSRIVNESELVVFENALSKWDDDFPSYIDRCFQLGQLFSTLNQTKALSYISRAINDSIIRHGWHKDTIVSYLLVDALAILWRNNWAKKETLKEYTNQVFELALRVYEITDKDHTWEGPNNVIELVLDYDIEFAETLWTQLIEKTGYDYFQNSLVTKLLVTKARQGFPIEEIESGMNKFRYDYYRYQEKFHFDYYLEKFPVYLEIAESDLYTDDEKKQAFEKIYKQTEEIRQEADSNLNRDKKVRFEKLCKKYGRTFNLSFEEEKDEDKKDKFIEKEFVKETKKVKTRRKISALYRKLDTYVLTELQSWEILLNKTFEICGNIRLFTSCLKESFFPSTDHIRRNSEYFHLGVAIALRNIDMRQEMLEYLYENAGHAGFANVMKSLEVNNDRKMSLLLFERYLRFCSFIVN